MKESLAVIPGFGKLRSKELRFLLEHSQEMSVRKNGVVIREHDTDKSFFLLLEGSVRIFRTSPSGRQITLAMLSPGKFFGELALFSEGGRTAHAEAVTPVRLLKIDGSFFEKELEHLPGLSALLLRELASRLIASTQKLSDAAFEDVERRLLVALESLAIPDEARPGARIVTRRPTQLELAEMVGSTREVICRVLKSLEQSGVIRSEGRCVRILST